MATMDVSGRYDEVNELLRFTVEIEGLLPDYAGSRLIVFELGNRGYYILISTRSISGDGSYSFSSNSFTKGNTYIGRFKLLYKNQGAEEWSTSLTLSSDPIEVPSDRPDDFTFPSSVRSGAATTTVTASKWNSFQDRINEFQAYKGVAQTSFYDVEPGDEMTASLMRKAWDAINGISGHGTMPTRPSSGATIYASWFHDLADALNEIE